VVNPKLGINSMAELIAYAKANPGKLNYANSGFRRRCASVGGTVQVGSQGRHRVGVLQWARRPPAGPDRRACAGDVCDSPPRWWAFLRPAPCGHSP
jgi:hypothetical protein